MKKLLVVLALGSFAACNSGTSTENKADSAIEAKKDIIDSAAEARKNAIDSTTDAKKALLDSSAKVLKDTTGTKK